MGRAKENLLKLGMVEECCSSAMFPQESRGISHKSSSQRNALRISHKSNSQRNTLRISHKSSSQRNILRRY